MISLTQPESISIQNIRIISLIIFQSLSLQVFELGVKYQDSILLLYASFTSFKSVFKKFEIVPMQVVKNTIRFFFLKEHIYIYIYIHWSTHSESGW